MRNGSRGQVIIIFVLFLFVLLGFAALAIDVGYLFSVRGELQRCADAGALAGAYVLHGGSWDDKGEIKEDHTQEYAAMRALILASRDPVGGKPLVRGTVSKNGEVKGGEVDVGFEKDDKNEENRIRVTAHRKVDLFFAGIFGSPAITLSADATAAAEPVDREVSCLTPLAIPYKDDLVQGREREFKVANPTETVSHAAADGEGKLFALNFCDDPPPPWGFISRMADPCMDKGSCTFQVGGPNPTRDPIISQDSILEEIYKLVFDPEKGDPDSQWEKWEKDLPGSSKFKEDTWMYSPRVMRVILYDKDEAILNDNIRIVGFAGFWIKEFKDLKFNDDGTIKDPSKVKVKGRYLSANAVGDSSNPPTWPPNLKIPSLKTTRLVK